ncbi:MAG: hypothetical protein WCT25_04250 [Candidatus Paceibacterota bacterium]
MTNYVVITTIVGKILALIGIGLIFKAVIREENSIRMAGLFFASGIILLLCSAAGSKNVNLAKSDLPADYKLEVNSEYRGAGNVLQSPTNIADGIGLGVVIIHSSDRKTDLGQTPVLMNAGLKVGEPIVMKAVEVVVNNHPIYFMFVAEKLPTNNVAAATAK